nr:STAS domain-containing protein [Pseudonocardia sp. C8]
MLRLDVVGGPGRPVRVRCLGEVDTTTAAQLERDLCRWIDASCCVLLDLSSLEFVDASGLSGLVAAFEHARRAGHPLRLGRRCSRPVRRALAASGLLTLFDEAGAGPGCPRHPGTGRA